MNRALTLTSAVAATSLPAFGAILNVNFGMSALSDGETLTTNATPIFVDLVTGATRSGSSPSSTEIMVRFRQAVSPYNAKAELFAATGGPISFAQNSAGYIVRYGYGASINQSAATFDGSGFTEGLYNEGPWGGFTGVAFVGFRNGSNVGWLAMDYQAGAPGGSIELLQLQYGNAGEPLNTPAVGTYTAVPEPSATAALLAGSAAVFALRRRRKA